MSNAVTCDLTRVRVAMEQMERLMRALEDLQMTVLPQNPALFATLAEGPLTDLKHLRRELSECVRDLQQTD